MSTEADLLAATSSHDLVPGDPGRLHEVAGLLQSYAVDLASTATAFTTLAPASWTGQAADRFRAEFDLAPGHWRTAADAFAQASRALSVYATSLLLAQDDAQDALARFRRGMEHLGEDAVTGGRGGMGAVSGADDLGAHDRELAVTAVDEARGRVRTAGDTAHDAVRSASTNAPEAPTWWQTTATFLGAVALQATEISYDEVIVPTINAIATVTNAVTTNPAGSLSIGAGALLVLAGGIVDAGGVAVCATGVGCAATPAAEAAGTGMIVTGIATVGAGAFSVSQTAAANPITIVNQIGGSGKPRPDLGPISGQRPAGVGDGWHVGPARDGKGTVWQEPGRQDDANQVRFKDPDARYPYGSVRFYNEHGQPVDLNGKPTGNANTHIPMEPDGSYPVPKGWNP